MALINRTSLLHNFHLDYLGHWSILGQALRESLGLPGMAFIAAALCAPYTLLRRRAGRAVLLAMIVLCLGSLYIYAAGPYSGKMRPDDDIGSVWIGRQMRYGFPFWGLLAAIAGAQIRTPLSPLVRWILGGVATVATVDALRHSGMFLEWYPRRSPALLVCAIGLCFAASTPALRRITSLGSIRLAAWWRRRPGAIIGAGIVMALLVMLLTSHTTLSALRVRQDVRNSLNGGISRFIDEDLPANDRIGFWATHKGYLLYGQDLRRPLHSLALHAPSTWEEMLAYVRAEPVDVIAVGPLVEQSRLHGWLNLVADHKSGLQRIHGDDVRNDVLVYRVLPATP